MPYIRERALILKKTAIIALILFTSFLSAFCGTLSVITMKNGLIYKGKIIDFNEGVYTVEINGKDYSIRENDIRGLGWENDGISGSDLSDTLGMRKKKQIDEDDERHIMFYINPGISYLQFGPVEMTSVFGGGMYLYGINAGWEFRSGAATSVLGLEFLAGSISGTLVYDDVLKNGASSITGEKNSKDILMLTFGQKARTFFLKQLSAVIDIGIGGGINFDGLDNYPVVDDYLGPTGHYAPLNNNYGSIAANGEIGMEYNLNDNLFIKLGCGYQFLSMDVYKSSQWIQDKVLDSTSSPSSQNAGGIIYTLSAGLKL
jgi:hypothetical protein